MSCRSLAGSLSPALKPFPGQASVRFRLRDGDDDHHDGVGDGGDGEDLDVRL